MMKEKKKICITIDRSILSKVDEITTNKSRLIELLLVEYFKKLGKDTSNIYL